MRSAVRLHFRFTLTLAALGVGITLLSAQNGDFVGPPGPEVIQVDDPFPIRRILLPSNQVAAQIELAKQGILVRLPISEFEARVRKAALNQRQQPEQPRLVEAHYRAELLRNGADDVALNGTAEWKIVHNGVAAALLPLESLRIALRQARWTDNRHAQIGLLDPRPQFGLALLVEQPGQHSLALEWSSKGLSEPGQFHFDLQVPVSPIATLDLELPMDVVPAFPQDGVLVNGPIPLEGRLNWRIAFGGVSHLEFSIRPANSPSRPPPPMVATIAVRQDLSAGSALCEYKFDFKVLEGDVTELVLEHDPDLTLTEITAPNIQSQLASGDLSNGRKRVVVRLREAIRSGQIRVTATAPIPFNENTLWASPEVQLHGAITRGENLRIRLAPEMRMSEWKSGTFRLIRSDFAADRTQTLTLESTLLNVGQNSPIRPSARFRPPRTEYRVNQELDWSIAADRNVLASRLTLEVQRGALSQLSVELPAGWEVEQVESAQKESNPNWTVSFAANPLLQIDFPKPLTGGTQGEITIRLRQNGTVLASGAWQAIPLPDLLPKGFKQRRGVYRIRVGQAFLASAPQPFDELDPVGPKPPEANDGRATWKYVFHDRPPAEMLYLFPRTSRLTVRSDTTVSFEAGQTFVAVRLSLQPKSGARSSLLLFATEPLQTPGTWRTVSGNNQVQSIQPFLSGDGLAILGALGPARSFEAASRLQVRQRGQWWQLNFSRPLDSSLTIESMYEPSSSFANSSQQCLKAASALAGAAVLAPATLILTPQLRQHIPLLKVVGADEFAGLVTVNRTDGAGPAIETTGLIREQVKDRQETFRYTDGPLSLAIENDRALVQQPKIDGADLLSVADPAGVMRCLYRFRVKDWRSPTLPVNLTVGADVREITVAGLPIAVDAIRLSQSVDGVCCSFPVPQGPEWQRIEILFDVPTKAWIFATRLVAPVPGLPVSPSTVKTTWRLPPDTLPVSVDSMVRLPGGPSRESRRIFPSVFISPESHQDESRDRAMDAPNRYAPKASSTGTRTFRQILANTNSTGERPILDSAGLIDAGVRETTIMPTVTSGPAAWESIGLVLVNFSSATVLTSPHQQSLWRKDAGAAGSLPISIREALRDAVQFGRDESGRFRTIPDWLETLPHSQYSSLLAELGGDDPGWTTWEDRSRDVSHSVEVVRIDHVNLVGWLLATVLLAIGILCVGHLGRAGIALSLLWLLAAGSALLWLPQALDGLAVGPMLSGLLVAIISIWRWPPLPKKEATAIARPTRSRRGYPLSGSARAVAIVVALGFTARAAAPEMATVYLLPGPASDPTPKSVLASPALLQRLSLLEQSRLALNDAVFLRARYTGHGESSGMAEFEAHFDVVTFVAQSSLVVPIGDARLREALLDGAAAFPTTQGAERCIIEIRGKGEHRLDLKFALPIAGAGAERDVFFNTPELAVCQLTFSAPSGAEHLQAMNWHGAQALSPDGKEIKTDLGRTRSVHVRWRQAGIREAPIVRVQEAAVWDIDSTSATLLSVFDYKISQGSVISFKIALPAHIDISRVEVRPEASAAGAPPTWVKAWHVGSNRILTVDLQSSLTGAVRLMLDGIPNRQITLHPILQYPMAVDVTESEAFVAFRLRGVETTTDFERRGVSEFSAESFLRDIWRNANVEKLATPVTRAFRRVKHEVALLRPVLQITPPASQGTQELIWWIGPTGAEMRGTEQWHSNTAPLTFVEWEVPRSIVIAEVRGTKLQSWLRVDNRVQVWLREPATDVSLFWNGHWQRSGAPVGDYAFDMPSIRLEGVASQTTTLRVRPPTGWTATPDNPAGFGSSIPALTDRELAWQQAKSLLPGRFMVRAPQSDALFHTLSIVDTLDRRLDVTTHIDPVLRRDRPHSFVISVRESEGWETTLHVPAICRAVLGGTTGERKEWLVDVPVRENEAISFRVNSRRSLPATQEMTLPDTTIKQGAKPCKVDRLFLLLGPEIRQKEVIGLRRVIESPIASLAVRPDDAARLAEKGGSLWRGNESDVRFKVLASPLPLGTSPGVRVILADLETAPLGGRWVFRASVDLLHEGKASLSCVLPLGSRLEGLALDGVESHVAGGNERFSISLPMEPGARFLQLVWTNPAASWDLPRFESTGLPIPAAEILWSAYSRAGERIEADGSLSLASLELHRADALLRLVGERDVLDEAVGSRILIRAARWLRLAEVNLNGPKFEARSDERGPSGQPMAEWLQHLKEQTTAMRFGLPRPDALSIANLPLREQTFERLPYADAFRCGIPAHWSVVPNIEPQAVRVRTRPMLPAIASFVLLAVAITALGTLKLFAPSLRPEQIAVTGIVGFAAFGFHEGLVFLVISAMMALVRLALIGNRVARWIGR